MDSIELKNELAHHTGSEQIFFHNLNRNVNYTEGVRAFARNAGGGAYWLLDILATQPEILKGVRANGMCVVILDVKESVEKISTAKLTVAADYSEEMNRFDGVAYERQIDFTDCPPGVWKFYFVDYMIMLPSEY